VSAASMTFCRLPIVGSPGRPGTWRSKRSKASLTKPTTSCCVKRPAVGSLRDRLRPTIALLAAMRANGFPRRTRVSAHLLGTESATRGKRSHELDAINPWIRRYSSVLISPRASRAFKICAGSGWERFDSPRTSLETGQWPPTRRSGHFKQPVVQGDVDRSEETERI
jgi:hypothetical protein